jgi:hypothetical protein
MTEPDVEGLFQGLEVHLDPAPADWITLSVLPWGVAEGTRVGALLPPHYDGYVRIFHPAGRHRWAEVAAAGGRTLHPAAQFTNLIPRMGGGYGYNADFPAPRQGELHPPARTALRSILEPHTAKPESCWFCMWNGFGSLPQDVALRYGVVRAQARTYILLSGELADVARFGSGHLRGPQIWWPADRAWCVASEIDLDSTLVGGSGSLVEAILREPDLEALRVERETRLDHLGDEVNPRTVTEAELDRLRQKL